MNNLDAPIPQDRKELIQKRQEDPEFLYSRYFGNRYNRLLPGWHEVDGVLAESSTNYPRAMFELIPDTRRASEYVPGEDGYVYWGSNYEMLTRSAILLGRMLLQDYHVSMEPWKHKLIFGPIEWDPDYVF